MYGKAHTLSQLHYLHTIPQGGNVLVIGGGTGSFLEKLIMSNPHCKIDYIEKSYKMIELASKKVKGNDHISFVNKAFEEHEFEGKKYDAVICFFFLDLLKYNALNAVILKVDKLLIPEGNFLVADFRKSLLLKHRILLRSMYLFFKMATEIPVSQLYDFDTLIIQKGFCKKDFHTFYDDFIFSAVYEKKN